MTSTSGDLDHLNVNLCNCTKAANEGSSQGSQYMKVYEIPMVNIQQLQIKKITLNQDQTSIQEENGNNSKIVEKESEHK